MNRKNELEADALEEVFRKGALVVDMSAAWLKARESRRLSELLSREYRIACDRLQLCVENYQEAEKRLEEVRKQVLGVNR